MTFKMKGWGGYQNSPLKQDEKCYIDDEGKTVCPPGLNIKQEDIFRTLKKENKEIKEKKETKPKPNYKAKKASKTLKKE